MSLNKSKYGETTKLYRVIKFTSSIINHELINWEKARHGERDERWSMQKHIGNIKTIIQSRNEK